MLNKLLRMAKGMTSPDEMAELLGALGAEVEAREMTEEDARALVAAGRVGRKVFIVGRMGNERLLAMMVLAPVDSATVTHSALDGRPASATLGAPN